MKLSTIHIDTCSKMPPGLRTLLRETVSKASFDSLDLSTREKAYPYSLYFIDAAIKSQVLGEAGSNRLGSLLGAGLSGLQSMLTPNVANDIGPILALMTPQSGGLDAVRQLVSSAGQVRGSILDDQNWMANLFDALGIDDQQIQSNIINQLESDIGAGTQPAGTQPTRTQPIGALAGAVGAEKAATQNSINDIKSTLDLIATNRVNAQQELAKINAKIKALMVRMATSRHLRLLPLLNQC